MFETELQRISRDKLSKEAGEEMCRGSVAGGNKASLSY